MYSHHDKPRISPSTERAPHVLLRRYRSGLPANSQQPFGPPHQGRDTFQGQAIPQWLCLPEFLLPRRDHPRHPAPQRRGNRQARFSGGEVTLTSFRGTRSVSPESITPAGSMDSGPAPSGASRNDNRKQCRSTTGAPTRRPPMLRCFRSRMNRPTTTRIRGFLTVATSAVSCAASLQKPNGSRHCRGDKNTHLFLTCNFLGIIAK